VATPTLVSDDAAKEADTARAVFQRLGIAKDRLLMERQSRNTLENAEFSKAMLNPKPGERWLLVTSAYHMSRSSALSVRQDLPWNRIRSTGARAARGPHKIFHLCPGRPGARRDRHARMDRAVRLPDYGKTTVFLPGPASNKRAAAVAPSA